MGKSASDAVTLVGRRVKELIQTHFSARQALRMVVMQERFNRLSIGLYPV